MYELTRTTNGIFVTSQQQSISRVKVVRTTFSDHDMVSCLQKLNSLNIRPRMNKCGNYVREREATLRSGGGGTISDSILGGTSHFFLLTFYNFKSIGGHVPPPPRPPPPQLRGPCTYAKYNAATSTKNLEDMKISRGTL